MAETTQTTYDGDRKTIAQHVVTTFENAQSSIEITTNSKGQPQPSIKMYCENTEQNMQATADFVVSLYHTIRAELGMDKED